MGGNSPSHLSKGDGEGGGVTFVQGIRLSDRVINRMKRSSLSHSGSRPSHSPETHTASPVPTPSVEPLLPLLTSTPVIPTTSPSASPPQEAPSTPPSVEPAPSVRLVPPQPAKFHSLPPTSVKPVAPPAVETTTTTTTPPAVNHVNSPSSTAPSTPFPVEPVSPPPAEPFNTLHLEPGNPSAESATDPSDALASPFLSKHVKQASPPVPEVVVPSMQPRHPSPPETTAAKSPTCPEDSAPVKATSSQLEPLSTYTPAPESPMPRHSVERAVVPVVPDTGPPAEEPTLTPVVPPVEGEAAVPPPAAALPVPTGVLEDKLRQEIKVEMQRSLEEEINQKRRLLQQQLEQIRAHAQEEAKAAARAQVEEQVKKTLASEKAAYMENLTESIMKERAKTEDESLLVQLYWLELKAHQLEEKEKELKKQDALHKEHVAKLEAKCTEFYKVTAESFQKGKEETHNRFARFNIQPVCGDLQSEILKCYKENTGKTLSCSRIASAYMQCVDNAKKNKLSIGG